MSDTKSDIKASGVRHAALEVEYYLVANGAAVKRVITSIGSEEAKLRNAMHLGEVQHFIPFTEIERIVCYAGQTRLQIDGVGYMTRYDDFDYDLPVHYELHPAQPILCACGGQLRGGEFTLESVQESGEGQERGYVECCQCEAKIKACRTLAARSRA